MCVHKSSTLTCNASPQRRTRRKYVEFFHGLRRQPETSRNLPLHGHRLIKKLVNVLQDSEPIPTLSKNWAALGYLSLFIDEPSESAHLHCNPVAGLQELVVACSQGPETTRKPHQDCKNLSLLDHKDQETGRMTSYIKRDKKHANSYTVPTSSPSPTTGRQPGSHA